jgi:hypothetical protein
VLLLSSGVKKYGHLLNKGKPRVVTGGNFQLGAQKVALEILCKDL